jgi:hypothetical protein
VWLLVGDGGVGDEWSRVLGHLEARHEFGVEREAARFGLCPSCATPTYSLTVGYRDGKVTIRKQLSSRMEAHRCICR